MKIRGIVGCVALQSCGLFTMLSCTSSTEEPRKTVAETRNMNSNVQSSTVGSNTQNQSATTEYRPTSPLVYIALINDDDLSEVGRRVKSELRARGIESSLEGGGAGVGVSVREPDVEMAVKAITHASGLIGRGIRIRDEFAHLVTNRPPMKRAREELIIVGVITNGADIESAETVQLELLKSGVSSTLLSSSPAGITISVPERDREKAAKVIAESPKLGGIGIRR